MAAHNDHSEELSAQYEPEEPLPSQARDQETEHLKVLQYTQNSRPHQNPIQAAEHLGHGGIRGILQFIIQNLKEH